MLCNLTTDILDQVLKRFVSSEKKQSKTKQNKEYNSKKKNKKQEMQL